MGSRVTRPSGVFGLRQLHPDGFQFSVLVVREYRFVATKESRLLESAERCSAVAFGKTVHRNGSGAERAGHPMSSPDVLRVKRSRQAVIGVVRQGDRFRLRLKGEDRQHRAEDFLAT